MRKFSFASSFLILGLSYVIYKMIRANEESRKLFLGKNSELVLVKEWLERKNEGIFVSEYFLRNGYKSVIIYGAGTFGKTLVRELEGTDINVKFFVNSTPEYYNVTKPVILLEELDKNSIDENDVFVVTPIEHYGKIVKCLREITDNTIVSLEEVINIC